MTRIDEPHPRDEALSWKPMEWPVRSTIAQRPPLLPPSAHFSDVIRGRRSQRRMARPSIGQVLEVLQLSAQLHGEWIFQGVDRYHAPSVSAGGLHGVDIFLVPSIGRARLFRYDRKSGNLGSGPV